MRQSRVSVAKIVVTERHRAGPPQSEHLRRLTPLFIMLPLSLSRLKHNVSFEGLNVSV
jgi:hypothetical protein